MTCRDVGRARRYIREAGTGKLVKLAVPDDAEVSTFANNFLITLREVRTSTPYIRFLTSPICMGQAPISFA
jgi:hypothetical protein